MLPILYHAHLLLRLLSSRAAAARVRARPEAGQTSAEYALVLLGAAAVAMLVVAWARSSGKVGDLLDGILEEIIETAT
jgi:Flp pilus assembly pilin Flp